MILRESTRAKYPDIDPQNASNVNEKRLSLEAGSSLALESSFFPLLRRSKAEPG